MLGPSAGKKGGTKVPSAGLRPQFELGSRPENMRSPLPGARIKPAKASTTQYGKVAPTAVASFDPMQGP